MTTLADRYLNLNTNNFNFLNVDKIENYVKYFKEFNKDPENIRIYIENKIISFVDIEYNKINKDNCEINYFIEKICEISHVKFFELINMLDINLLISMLNYYSDKKIEYKNFKTMYNKYFFEKIIEGNYKIKDTEYKMNELFDNNWNNIKFHNIVKFSQLLNKMNYYLQDVQKFQKIIDKKFDDINNIKKLIDYISKTFIEIDENDEYQDENLKFNFRFVIDNLKSNGYLLFEEYNKILKNRYKQNIKNDLLKKDKKLIRFFLFIVSEKEENSVNSSVNEILIRMKNYIYDLEDNYNNNIGYKSITITQDSEKYKNVDLSTYNRNICDFNIFKYTKNLISDINNYKLNDEILPYFDIYKSFYKSRYPDRNLEFNLIKSTIIVKFIFKEKIYYIHMAIIQYLILDLLFKNNDGISIYNLSEILNIDLEFLEKSINSLLKITLIKRFKLDDDLNDIENIYLSINYNFENENKKISIQALVDEDTNINLEKDYLHDRDTIVLSNLYDYIKKNKFITNDVLLNDLQYKIPFKINIDQINNAIKTAIEKDHLKKIEVPNSDNTSIQIMYEYIV